MFRLEWMIMAYREAVNEQSPRLPLRLPWDQSNQESQP